MKPKQQKNCIATTSGAPALPHALCSRVRPASLEPAHGAARGESDMAPVALHANVANGHGHITQQAHAEHGVEHAAALRQRKVGVGVRHAGHVGRACPACACASSA